MTEISKLVESKIEKKENPLGNIDSYDAFMALSLALLQDMWTTSDSKVLLFMASMSNLEKMGYSKEDIEEYRKGVNNIVSSKLMHKNDFMG